MDQNTAVETEQARKERLKRTLELLSKMDLPRKPFKNIDLMGSPGTSKAKMFRDFGNARSADVVLPASDVNKMLGNTMAQACHDGTAEPVPCMKPLQIKRGFSWVM